MLRKGLPGSHYHTSGWLEGHTMVASPPMASSPGAASDGVFLHAPESCVADGLGPGWGLNLEGQGCTFEVSETRALSQARFLFGASSGRVGGEFQASMPSMAVKYSSQKLRTNAV